MPRSDDCSAGGVGPVRENNAVFTEDNLYGDPVIGRWPRTAAVHCKAVITGPGASFFRVEIRDKAWTGLWLIVKKDTAQAIDDTAIPSC